MFGFFITQKKRVDKHVTYTGICFLLSLTLITLSRISEGFAEWYALHLFPVFPNSIGRIFSYLPFSAFEFLICFFIVLSLFYFIKLIWLLFRESTVSKSDIKRRFLQLSCIFSTFFLLFSLTGAINYSREPLAESAGLPVQESTSEELKQLSLLLINDISELTSNEQFINYYVISDQKEIQKTAIEAMENLGSRYPALTGYYPNAKPVQFSGAMSYLGIRGIYSPLTVEANYNNDIVATNIPYTICHELSHLKGYMREEEAGFLAYLACRDSDSKQFQYSGAINALIFVLNALHEETTPEEFAEIYNQIPGRIKIDFDFSRAYSEQHDSAMATIARSANNLYLNANAQSNGIKSYGLMVDLLLAEYADKIRESDKVL